MPARTRSVTDSLVISSNDSHCYSRLRLSRQPQGRAFDFNIIMSFQEKLSKLMDGVLGHIFRTEMDLFTRSDIHKQLAGTEGKPPKQIRHQPSIVHTKCRRLNKLTSCPYISSILNLLPCMRLVILDYKTKSRV